LKAGQLVMTGSLIPPVFPKAGETYVFKVEDLAPVELRVE
jgi:2-keto-4-pentenoate hydratase